MPVNVENKIESKFNPIGKLVLVSGFLSMAGAVIGAIFFLKNQIRRRLMKNKIKRHSIIELIEHWSIALSGIVLLFTGLGCLPLYKRYYITEIPGFAWTADFYYVTTVHYVASAVFVAAVVFHIFYHGLRKDFALLPKKKVIYLKVSKYLQQ